MKGGGEKEKGIFWRIRGHDWSIINVRFTDATSQDRKCGGDVAKNQHLSERCIFWNVRLHLAIRVIKKRLNSLKLGRLAIDRKIKEFKGKEEQLISEIMLSVKKDKSR